MKNVDLFQQESVRRIKKCRDFFYEAYRALYWNHRTVGWCLCLQNRPHSSTGPVWPPCILPAPTLSWAPGGLWTLAHTFWTAEGTEERAKVTCNNKTAPNIWHMRCNHWNDTADRPSLQKESCPASWDPPGEGSRSGGAVWVPEALFSSVPGIWGWNLRKGNAAGAGPHWPGGRRQCWTAENTLPTCWHSRLVVPSAHKPHVSQKGSTRWLQVVTPSAPLLRRWLLFFYAGGDCAGEWSACPERRWSPDRVKARVKEGKIALKIIIKRLSICFFCFNFPSCLMSCSASKRLQVRTTVQR